MKSVSEQSPPLMTVEEVARLFRFTRGAIRRMIRAKSIPAIRIGNAYRIPRQVVDNILNPLSQMDPKEAAFGMWKGKKNIDGATWVRKHRDADKRSLEEFLEDLAQWEKTSSLTPTS